MLSTSQESHMSLEELLLDLCSTLIGPNMPSPWEILHNRTFQYSSKLSTPLDMESVQNFLFSKRQYQKTNYNRAHSARELQELQPSQEVLFLSPTENEYIPSTIINKATAPHSYYIEAQGKCYQRTRKHTRPIHLNLPQPMAKSPTKLPKPSHIPKPNPTFKPVPQPKKSTYPPIHILQCITAISPNPYTPPGLYPNQALAPFISPHVLSNS